MSFGFINSILFCVIISYICLSVGTSSAWIGDSMLLQGKQPTETPLKF